MEALTLHGDAIPTVVPSKAEIPDNAQSLCDVLLERMSAKDAYVYLYARAEVEKAALDILKESVIVSLDGKSETVLGAKVEMRKKPSTFEYHDGTLQSLYNKLDALEAEIKAREAFNKSLPPSGMDDPATGERIEAPTVTLGGATIAVTLAGGGR